ncbi:MAG: hypothetical protein M1308_08060, partial [Actinobacteria bacterium]|nr:hypothetical protein [Actinomycetota bacterium]
MSKKIRASLIAVIIIFTLSFILLIPGAIFAQEETAETTAETVVIPKELTFNVTYPSLNAKAGNNYEFTVELTYMGEEDADFNLAAEFPEDWYVTIAPSFQAESDIKQVKLTPGKKETLKVTAYPPVTKELQQAGDYEIKV